jgi:hypothetical protein
VDDAWAFLKEFSYDPPATRMSWDDAGVLANELREFEGPLRDRLRIACDRSNRALLDLGGDPLREDWSHFRPLRREREEDWSDWLAWLFKNSREGRFPRLLLRPQDSICAVEDVRREARVPGYRHDIVIRWSNGERTTIEVKVGDQAFEKTGPATQAYRLMYPRGSDFILLPRSDVPRCNVPKEVQKIVWDDVATSLRACIMQTDELVTWRVWARAFVGCVEQELLGLPPFDHVSHIGAISNLLRYLEDRHDA